MRYEIGAALLNDMMIWLGSRSYLYLYFLQPHPLHRDMMVREAPDPPTLVQGPPRLIRGTSISSLSLERQFHVLSETIVPSLCQFAEPMS